MTGASSPHAAIWRSSWDGPVTTSAVAGPPLVTLKLCEWPRGTKTKLSALAVPLVLIAIAGEFARKHIEHFVLARVHMGVNRQTRLIRRLHHAKLATRALA